MALHSKNQLLLHHLIQYNINLKVGKQFRIVRTMDKKKRNFEFRNQFQNNSYARTAINLEMFLEEKVCRSNG